ncbi:hypothetical protein BDN70DRAFT_490217 [Pholiota conissans]|uniref:Uncharacterized protein n=1 Tax=Pholiota conissans TaxID=109636 RepID=A0A9P6CSP1_9AGAR|nr:hypothetical protein BDN70DRAFT_490217 [Pholiota conissans]
MRVLNATLMQVLRRYITVLLSLSLLGTRTCSLTREILQGSSHAHTRFQVPSHPYSTRVRPSIHLSVRPSFICSFGFPIIPPTFAHLDPQSYAPKRPRRPSIHCSHHSRPHEHEPFFISPRRKAPSTPRLSSQDVSPAGSFHPFPSYVFQLAIFRYRYVCLSLLCPYSFIQLRL